MTIERYRADGFLEVNGVLPNEFFEGAMSKLATVSDHGELYTEETHPSTIVLVIVPALHRTYRL
jgi:hypothetical protein